MFGMMFEGEYANISIEDNILFLEYSPRLVLTYHVAKEVLSNRLAFQQNKAYPVFCNTSGIISAETNALDYLSHEGTLLIMAIAFYVNAPLNNLLTEFFLETHSRKIPAGIFKYRNQALKFLRPYTQ
ncbi:STAS/SEC14 domain-containing protein [Zunongwangia sp. F363]|uniref:STAS/SEC14 domain-containing protein n=1 Tax=Autumnicola tepida TaxID=3075595 RepID=A0ABU3CDU4_9FLAO|nr:STAS/SEC14 domain-containing protein [Zunongwangia sp. F363]MDT0644522.1 STAS/SEC14 domain-containing protein [Zunongwangia sp. F363]